MTFRVGQEVVCITDSWVLANLKLVVPKAKSTYVIRDTILRPWSPVSRGLRLIGINNATFEFVDGIYEPYFDAQFFRPLDKRATDITFAHEILRKASRKDRVWA
jgi:hypothetical protein